MSDYDKNKLFGNYPDDIVETLNSFMTPELQMSISNIYSLTADFSKELSCSFSSPAFSEFSKTINRIANSAFPPPAQQAFIDMLKRTNGVYSDIAKTSASFSSEVDHTTDENIEDYIIVEKPAIKEFEIPDSIAIPIGGNRVRIKTEVFLAIISLIFSMVVSVYSSISDHSDSFSDSKSQTQLSEENQEQTRILQEQTNILNAIFETLDVSNSSQKECLEDVRSAFQAQAEVPGSNSPLTDNTTESLNTEPDK